MRISKQIIINFILSLLAIIILTNLNFVLLITKGSFGILSPYIFILTILGTICMLVLQKNKIGPVALLFSIFITIYLINSFLSVIDSKLLLKDYINEVFSYLKSISIFILFYLYFKNLDLNNKLSPFFIFIIILLLLTNSTVFFMDLLDLNIRLTYNQEVIEDKWARASGIWGNANRAGSFCLINIIMLMYYTLKSHLSVLKRTIIFLSILFLLYCIYLTLSNTIFIITFFIIILYLYFFSKLIKTKTKLKIILISLLSILILTSFFLKDIKQQYENLTPAKKEKIVNVLSFFNIGEKKETSYSNRDKTLKLGFEKVKERPLTGNGLGSFQKNLYKQDGIHNFYMQLIGEGGVITLISYILLLVFLLFKIVSKNQFEKGFLLTSFFIFLLLFGLTTHGLFLVKGYCIIFALFFVLFENQQDSLKSNFL